MVILANELRIGNWVTSDLEEIPFQIHGINVYEDSIECNVFNKEHGDFNIISLQPIPITEDWLIRLGFEKTDLASKTYYENHKIRLNVGGKRSGYALYLHGWKGYAEGLKHIHKLQNLYFALTGHELTLK